MKGSRTSRECSKRWDVSSEARVGQPFRIDFASSQSMAVVPSGDTHVPEAYR
jgi:hypothetical protein